MGSWVSRLVIFLFEVGFYLKRSNSSFGSSKVHLSIQCVLRKRILWMQDLGNKFWNFVCIGSIAYVSVTSKPEHPQGDPLGFACPHYPGGRVSTNVLCPGSGFRVREIFYSFERKMQELLNLFQRNRRQLEKQVFLCCFISMFVKTVDVYWIVNNIYHFRPHFGHFDKIFRSPKGHFCQC